MFSFTWPWLQSLVLVLHSFFSFHFSCLDAMFGSLRLRRAKTSVSGTFLLFWFQTKPFFRKVKNHPRKRKSQQQLKSQLVCEMRPKVLCELPIECPPVIFSYILQPECGPCKVCKALQGLYENTIIFIWYNWSSSLCSSDTRKIW